MLGQTLGGATTAVLQGFMILVLSIFIGLHIASVGGFLIAFAFMVLIGISFTAFGIAIASRMEDMTGFQLIMNFVVFPIFGLSGALFPISSLPGWITPITMLDPLTYGVEGIRYGLTGVSQINPLVCAAVIGFHHGNDSARGIPVQEDQILIQGEKMWFNPDSLFTLNF